MDKHVNIAETEPMRLKPKPRKRSILRFIGNLLIVVVALTAVAAIVISGIVPRMKAAEELRSETASLAVPTVLVIQPKRGAPTQTITLPANIQPYADAPIFARTNGYLRKWYTDIGTHVKEGQLLAEIDTPEVDHQVEQARADLTTSEANYGLAQITTERYQDLLKTESVSKQEADNASGDFQARKSIVQSAQSNLKRLEELQSFQKIYAPFDGVITARNTDIGALIGNGAVKELFHIASTTRLRVYVSVPQVYSRVAKPGMAADLSLAEFPGRFFKANLVTTSEAIDAVSHTLLSEFDAENPTGELLPGSFAEVHLKLPSAASTLVLPVTAFLFRSEGIRIAIVKNNRADLIPVVLGRDFGNEAEVVSGLNGNDLVITNPPDSLVSGQSVRIVQSTPDVEKP
jgi:RND family efflux transporter MFP subunit